MNLIQKVLFGGSIFYSLIFVIELFQGHILWQALVGIGALGCLVKVSSTRNEHLLHQGEIGAVWICILLFGLYAILKSGGLV